MVAYLAILTAFAVPVWLGLLRPRTERWRRARRRFWRLLPAWAGVAAANVAFVDPAGPAWLYYGAWLVFVVVLALWCIAVGHIRGEWGEWRGRVRRERELAARTPDPEKPWLK